MIAPEKIWNSSQLPTLPAVAVRLLELSRDPETEISQVVAVIKSDPAIAAKILKATNSSFFGFKSQVTSLERAIPLLGTTVVTSLALTFSLVDSTMSSGPLAVHYQAYWQQSVIQALTAELISKRMKSGLDCELFLAGLLADLGRLALLKVAGTEYLPVLEAFAETPQKSLVELESEALGIDHVEVGTKLMTQWQLPESLITAIETHHASAETVAALEGTASLFGQAIAIACAVGDYFCTERKFAALDHLRTLAATHLQMGEEELNDFLDDVKSRLNDVGEVFSVDPSNFGDPAELMAQANEQLAQLAMAAHAATTQAEERQRAVEREREELQHRNDELQQRVLHDPLTRCYNRSFLDESLQREISNCQRTATQIGVIFVDIDHFKSVNDTYGHPFGDQVLVEISQILQSSIRSTDILARYGGEEFVIVAAQPTENGLQKVAERLRSRVEAHEIRFGEKLVPITISAGAIVGIPRRVDPEFRDRVIGAADEAMYDSKRNGRNRVTYRSLLSTADQRLMQQWTQLRFSRWLVSRKVLDIPTLSKALAECEVQHKRIGELAVEHGLLEPTQVDQILAQQQENGSRFGDIAQQNNWLTIDSLAALLALQNECPHTLLQTMIHLELIEMVPAEQLLNTYLAEIASLMGKPAPELVGVEDNW